jgi:protein CpxP
MNRNIITLLAFLISISLTQITFADNNNSKASCSCKNKLYKKLDLTAEQQTQIKAINDQASIIKLAKQKEMLKINNEIHELIKADKLDESKLDTLLTQKKDLMASIIKKQSHCEEPDLQHINRTTKRKI